MHVPDGFLSAPVAAATWGLAAAGLTAALRNERRDPAAIPASVLGSLAAFVFAAQMVNLPVAPGVSGHLVGATLLAVLVGPWRALIVMAVVLAVQALLFQDGGLGAWGANLIDLGAAGCFVGYTVAWLAAGARHGLRGRVIGAVMGAFAATLCGAALTSVWLGLSGLYPLRAILPLMLVTHSAIGLVESALTGAILVCLLRWRPDLVAGIGWDDGAAPPRRMAAIAIGALGLALLVAAFLAPLGSDLPDGLERTARDLGFASQAATFAPAWFFIAPLAPAVAGTIGTLAVAAVAWMAARGLSRANHVPHR